MATDHNFKVKKGIHVLGSEGIYLTDTNTRLHEGSGNALRISTGTGLIDIGSMNSGWVHMQANKNIYILPNVSNGYVSVDGHLQPYSDSSKTLGADGTRWSHIYGDALTIGGAVSSGKIEGTTADANGHILKTDSSTATASDVALQITNSSSDYYLKFQPRLPAGNMHAGVNTDDFGIFTSNSKGISIGNNNKSLVIIHPTDGLELWTNNARRFNIDTSGNIQVNGTTIIDTSRNLTNIGTISSGNITAGSSSTAAYLRAHYNDGSYMTLEGYGLVMNRGSSYIRPSSDGDKFLYIGGADASLDWNQIHFRSGSGLYMTGTQFLDTNRNLVNIGTINTGQGATEVHLMNQNVRSSDSPTFQDLTIQGNLSITGDINSYNVTDLDVVDKTITLGVGGTASANDGGGIIVDGADAKLTWNNTNSYWQMNKKLAFNDTATTSNQGLGLVWTGFDKEGTTDSSDSASIVHTTNAGGHAGSVLYISAQNDANDGIAFVTNASSYLKHNSNNIFTDGYHPNADTLTTARTIGGVSFNGSANINLPGVNTAGNQNTSGTAAGLSGTPNITVGTISSGRVTTSEDLRMTGNANLRSDNIFNFLTIGGSAQVGKFKAVAAQTSYVNSASDGMFNALNGYAVGTGNGTTVIDSSRNLTNIGTISGTGISTGANLVDLFNNQNGVNELRLDNNRQDLGNVPVSKVSGRNSVEVANMTFYRGGGGSSGFIRFQNKPTNAASLTDVFQVGDGATVGYGVDILAGGLRIGGTRKDGNWDTAYGWGNHASAGYITSSTGTLDSLRIASGGTTSDVQEGKEYKYYLVGMGLTDGNWKKVCDVTVGTGLYKALTMNIILESQSSNFGSANTTQTSKFSATYYRSGGTQDNTDNATISGHNTDNHELRILKTATGVYELQIKMLSAYKDAIVKIEVLSTNGGSVSVPSSIANGSTTGTAYTPSTSTSVKNLYNTIKTSSIHNTGALHNTGVIYLGSTATANDQFATNNGTDIFIGTSSKGLRTYKDLHTNSGNYKYWHEGNDGSGSGLDADTLDTIQASSFLRSDAADTASGKITFTAAESIELTGIRGGAVGSQTGDFIHLYERVNIGYPSGWGGQAAPSYGLSTHGGAQFNVGNVSNAPFTFNGNTVWHAGNDGTGSGLDADTVDGVEASSIISGSNSSGTNEGTVANWNSITKSGFYSHGGASNKWTTSNWSSVLHHKLYDNNNNYASQLGFDTYQPDLYYRMNNNGTWTSWYQIYHEGHKPTYSELGTMAYSNLTGTPTIPSLSGYATETYVGTQITNLIDSSPAALNTLNELAAALGDDANFSTTVNANIAAKLPLSGGTMTGALAINSGGNAITISSTAPQIRLNDTDHDDFWIHVNSDRFYILADRDASGSWETPYPLELNASTNIGYIFSHRAFTEAYHPNADKWTTARTLSLSNHATGSVSWDGSANATLSVTVTGGDSDTLDGHDHTSFEPHGTLSVSSDYQYGNAASSLYTTFTRSSATTDTDQHGRYYYSGTGQHRTKFIPIDKTASYRMKIRWKTSATKPTYIAVFLLDTSGSNITGSGTYWRYPWSGTNSPTSWTTNEYVYHANEMPSNAAYIAFGISHTNYGTSGATYYVSELELEKNNSVEYSAAGGVSQYYTSSRNLRGYIGATETDDGHFVIATSSNEDIVFKDGGISGTTNMVVRGDGNVYILGSIVNGTIPYSQVTSAPTIPTNNNQLTNGAGYVTASTTSLSNYMRLNATADVTNYSHVHTFYTNGNMASTSGSQSSLQCYNNTIGNDAFMTFHVGSDFACYFGLDGGTNKLSVGGWSMGANSYEIYHAGNKPSYSALGTMAYSNLTGTPTIPTNNNQLTNGAAYITSSGTASQSNMVTGSAFATTSSPSSVLEYQQASSITDTKLAPGGDWYNTIRLGHGNPYSYYSNTMAVKMTGTNVGQLYIQTISNNTAQGWRQVWDSSSDGSGSGLDADLLDGQHGSHYLNYNNLTNTPTIPTNYIPTGGSWYGSNFPGSRYNGFAVNGGEVVFARDNPNTGQMSILVDGAYYAGENNGFYSIYSGNSYNSKSGFYADTSGRLQFSGQNYAQFTTQYGNIKLGPMNTSYAHIYTDTAGGFYFNKTSLYADGNTMWHAGNDGSGSGLDADTVDGKHKDYLMHYKGVVAGDWDTLFSTTDGHMGVYEVQNITGGSHSNYPTGAYTYGGVLSWQLDNSTFKMYAPHTGSLYIQNGWNNDEYSGWRKVWDSGNDGSGSGLDADTVDSLQAASFLRSDASDSGAQSAANYLNLQYLYNNKLLIGNGTTSFVDAYNDSPWYGIGRTNVSGWYSGNNKAQMAFYWGLTLRSAQARIELSPASNGPINFGDGGTTNFAKINSTGIYQGTSNLVWHAGNDGAGSGLDADLLDGYNAEEGAVNNSIVKRDGTASIKAHGLSLMRQSTTTTGISWYNEAYYNWQDYMAAAGATSCGPNGNLTAPTGLAGVTSWALRSRMEGVSTYGWNWETGSGGGGGATATSKMSLQATTGNLQIAGSFTAGADVIAYSDEKLKDDVQVIENAVEKVKQVRGVTFTRNDLEDQERHAGVIAQEVEKVLPEVVGYDEDRDTKTVAYGNMVGLLIEAIKEQQETIDKLTSRINDIEKGDKKWQ